MSNLSILPPTNEAPGLKSYSDTVARGYYGNTWAGCSENMTTCEPTGRIS